MRANPEALLSSKDLTFIVRVIRIVNFCFADEIRSSQTSLRILMKNFESCLLFSRM